MQTHDRLPNVALRGDKNILMPLLELRPLLFTLVMWRSLYGNEYISRCVYGMLVITYVGYVVKFFVFICWTCFIISWGYVCDYVGLFWSYADVMMLYWFLWSYVDIVLVPCWRYLILSSHYVDALSMLCWSCYVANVLYLFIVDVILFYALLCQCSCFVNAALQVLIICWCYLIPCRFCAKPLLMLRYAMSLQFHATLMLFYAMMLLEWCFFSTMLFHVDYMLMLIF